MIQAITNTIASVGPPNPSVPDTGLTSLLLGGALISVFAISRYLKKRRK